MVTKIIPSIFRIRNRYLHRGNLPHAVYTLALLNSFNALIDGFIDDGVGLTSGFLTPRLAAQLRDNLLRFNAADTLLAAGTGNKSGVTHDQAVRRDKIRWLDLVHGDPHEAAFFAVMDAFVTHLNATCYTGITGYEFHYALYETGSFYKKHLDQFSNDSRRKYSMILYLTPDWHSGDGGELCIHTVAGLRHIAPIDGNGVFFRSNELEHEVLVTHKPRMSITGWLKVN